MFYKETIELLYQAGWTENRLVDTQHYEQILKQKGYAVFPPQQEFLSHFGGLKAEYHRPSHRWRSFHFDVTQAVTYTTPEELQHYMDDLGTELSVIGEMTVGVDDCLLAMTPNGIIYAMHEDSIWLVGRTEEEAINNLCTARV